MALSFLDRDWTVMIGNNNEAVPRNGKANRWEGRDLSDFLVSTLYYVERE